MNVPNMKVFCLLFVTLQPLLRQAFAFTVPSFSPRTQSPATRTGVETFRLNAQHQEEEATTTESASLSRRTWIQRNALVASTLLVVGTTTAGSTPVWAASRPPLTDLLYTILRVREATEQETRLISSGKFKDVQRANIKLAVRFMVENYRLADAFVAAAAYLDGNERRISAGNVGQAAVQNLVTILEYFDSADVQNLKVRFCVIIRLFVWYRARPDVCANSSLSCTQQVGSNAMAGKEGLVLKGLDATRKNIDEFLTYFPTGDIETAKAKIESENQLNIKEFDPELGAPINLPPKTT